MDIPTNSRPLVRKEVRYLKRLLPFCRAVGWEPSHSGEHEVTDSLVAASSEHCIHARLDPETGWTVAAERQIGADEDAESVAEQLWLEAAGEKAEELIAEQNP